MADKRKLAAFFLEQYQLCAEGKRSRNLRIKDLGQRVSRLRSSLRSARADRIGYTTLEDYHKQVRNLYIGAAVKHNDGALSCIRHEMIPDLVRLNIGLLMPEQREGIDDRFLDYLRTEESCAVCYKPLLFLYPAYKEKIIRTQMTQLVPTRPELEFPEALKMDRRFILHIGPTNSGKTFQALERLRTAENGMYLGPLRLLALEVYERMRDAGVAATMLTGQECIEDPDSRITAATVEMADYDKHFEVVVIDEAQLMADPDRGHSWTKAILGIKADEIHVCASPAAERALIHLIQLTGDTCEINHYERKTDLVFEKKPFSFPEDVRQGDALIVFSKKNVLDVAGRLESEGIETSVIYGSLPPEIRRRQMHLFAEGKTKVVVSTDAIGMGLNLPVRRIVFLQVSKYDGTDQRLINTSEIRQIAGRAGRFGLYDTGYVTAGDEDALAYITRTALEEDPEVETVNLGFPQVLLDIDEPLDEILKVWHDQKPEAPFEKENVDEALFLYEKAREMHHYIPGFEDKRQLYRMISTPVDIKDRTVVRLWLEYCMNYMAAPELEKPRVDYREKNPLLRYETYYKELDLYWQMSARLGKEADEDWVREERSITEERIMRFLLKDKTDYIKRCRYCGKVLPIDSPYNCCKGCLSGTDYREKRGGRRRRR